MIRFNFLILIILPACLGYSQKQEKIKYETYKNETIGWTIRFPSSFKVMTVEEIDEIERHGQTAFEETFDEKPTFTSKNLLWLKNDLFNGFTSQLSTFDSLVDGSYKDYQEMMCKATEEIFKNQGIQFDANYGYTKVDELDFLTMNIILYTVDRKEIIMNMVMYNRLINGSTSLNLSISYNNEKDKEALLDILNSSKLSMRH